jgi:hypothetical protein
MDTISRFSSYYHVWESTSDIISASGLILIIKIKFLCYIIKLIIHFNSDISK